MSETSSPGEESECGDENREVTIGKGWTVHDSTAKMPKAEKSSVITPANSINDSNIDGLMTETLAKVYLAQKKYENALVAYRILSLKNPEKSSFFANQITKIEQLQKNKS